MESESAVMPDSRDGVGPTTECRGKSARRLHSPTPLPFPSLALLFANNNARRKIHKFNFCWFKSVTISSFYKQIGNRKVWFDFVFPPSCRQLSTSSTIYHSDLGRISSNLLQCSYQQSKQFPSNWNIGQWYTWPIVNPTIWGFYKTCFLFLVFGCPLDSVQPVA